MFTNPLWFHVRPLQAALSSFSSSLSSFSAFSSSFSSSSWLLCHTQITDVYVSEKPEQMACKLNQWSTGIPLWKNCHFGMRTSLFSQQTFSRSCDNGCISRCASTRYIGPHALPGWLPDFLPDSNCKNDRITERNQFENSTVDEQFFPKNPRSCPGKKKMWFGILWGWEPTLQKMSILLGIVSLETKLRFTGLQLSHNFRWMSPVSTSQKRGQNPSF